MLHSRRSKSQRLLSIKSSISHSYRSASDVVRPSIVGTDNHFIPPGLPDPKDIPSLPVLPVPGNDDEKTAWSRHLEGASLNSFPRQLDTSVANQDPQSLASITGGSCEVNDAEVSSQQAVGLVSAAWAIVLSRHSESTETLFGLQYFNSPQVSSSMLPMRVQVDRLQLVSQFLPYVRKWSDRVISSQLGLEDIRSLNAGAEVAAGFQTVIRFLDGRPEGHNQSSSPNYGDKPEKSSQYSLVIHCSRYGGALSFLAEFNQTILPTPTVRLLIDDLEHAVWQIINGRDDQALRLDSLEQLGPHARRQLLRYNRP